MPQLCAGALQPPRKARRRPQSSHGSPVGSHSQTACAGSCMGPPAALPRNSLCPQRLRQSRPVRLRWACVCSSVGAPGAHLLFCTNFSPALPGCAAAGQQSIVSSRRQPQPISLQPRAHEACRQRRYPCHPSCLATRLSKCQRIAAGHGSETADKPQAQLLSPATSLTLPTSRC